MLVLLFHLLSNIPSVVLHDIVLPDENYVKNSKCWGYENDCDIDQSFSKRMRCSRSEDIHTFFKEADFGYVAKRINSMEDICVPQGLDLKNFKRLKKSFAFTFTYIPCKGLL